MKKLTASDGAESDVFGLSVAVNGDTAVVGAWFGDAGGTSPGAAYVFQRDQGGAGNWGEMKKLTASDGAESDVFGLSVAVTGDTAVVGAWFGDAGGFIAGAAFVFGQPTKLVFPGDTDGDGCADTSENRPNPELYIGGGRDYVNPWDYYDTDGDGVIDHYSLDGSPPFDVQFDRGPSAGPNPWNMTAPDGVIDLFTEVLGVIQQFGHDCR